MFRHTENPCSHPMLHRRHWPDQTPELPLVPSDSPGRVEGLRKEQGERTRSLPLRAKMHPECLQCPPPPWHTLRLVNKCPFVVGNNKRNLNRKKLPVWKRIPFDVAHSTPLPLKHLKMLFLQTESANGLLVNMLIFPSHFQQLLFPFLSLLFLAGRWEGGCFKLTANLIQN